MNKEEVYFEENEKPTNFKVVDGPTVGCLLSTIVIEEQQWWMLFRFSHTLDFFGYHFWGQFMSRDDNMIGISKWTEAHKNTWDSKCYVILFRQLMVTYVFLEVINRHQINWGSLCLSMLVFHFIRLINKIELFDV